MAKIVFFASDPGSHKFLYPIIDRLEKQGFQTQLLNNYGPVDDADYYWFDYVDNNLIVASKEYAEDLKKKKLVIARLHAVEYYVGHYLGVDWTNVDYLIFVSEHMKRRVGELPHVKEVVIPNVINTEKLTFKEREPGFNIGYAGNIVPAKGILIMFQYMKLLVNRDPRYKLYMVGLSRFHGREGEYYDHYLNVTGLKDHVFQADAVEDIDKWFEDNNINYLWNPSLAESFSIIVGEAMAKGIKPLINNWQGSTETYPKELIYKDFDEFYELIKGGYNSKFYRNYVERYSLSNVMNQINELFLATK